jgi:hypothetical protein
LHKSLGGKTVGVNYIKKKVVIFFWLLVMACALQAVGFCDQMVFVDVNGPNPGGGPYPGDAYGGHYYVSPYYGKDLTTGQSNILLFCLDFNHEINFGQQWTATIHSVPSTQAGFTATASTFQFGNVPNGSSGPTFVQPAPSGQIITLNSWQRYQVATRLFGQELSLLGPSLQSTSAAFARDRAVYQYAVWEVFLENNYTVGGSTYNYYNDFMSSFNVIGNADHNFKADVKAVLDEALANSTADLDGWTVVSPATANTPGSEQEFLSRSFAINPEPSSIVLLGTIILFGATRLRRKVRQG